MKVYKIHVQHFSQKDSHSSIECFVLANNDEDVYDWLDKREFGYFSDRENDGETFSVYDKDYNVIGEESFKERMLRLGGEYFDEDYCPQDLYCGCTIYGWEKLKSELFQVEIDALKKLDVLVDLINAK